MDARDPLEIKPVCVWENGPWTGAPMRSTLWRMKVRRLFLAAALLGSASFVACLGRTGIGVDDLAAAGGESPGDDAFVDTGVVEIDSGVGFDTRGGDTTVGKDTGRIDSRPPPPDSIDFFDLFPIPDSGPIGACATCVADHCRSQVNACLNDTACRNGMVCTVMKCLGGGGTPDFACVLGCFGGDFGEAAKAISAFTCVISSCGSTCGGIFGGGRDGGGPPPTDAGGGGGGGGSAGGGSGGAPMSIDHAWTAEEVMSVDPSTQIRFSPAAFDAWHDELFGAGCGAK